MMFINDLDVLNANLNATLYRTTQELLNFDKQSQVEIPIENYQLIKIPNSQLHLVDTYIITNLDSSSTYEIKMTFTGQNGKLVNCETSNTVYGLTLNKSQAQDIAAQLPQQFRTASPMGQMTTLSNQAQKQNEILFMILGIILGVLSLLLGIFVMMCVIRHKQHKRLLIKLNTSQKLNGGSSCPTLIYDDCLRNLNQNTNKSSAAAVNSNNLLNDALSGLTSTLNNNNNYVNLLNSAQNSTTFNNTQTTLLSTGGSSLQQPPPIPAVPPPHISSTLNRNINLSVNPIGYLDANTLNFIKQQQAQIQQQHNQENFYHTLNFNNNNGTLMHHHFNTNDYTNATLNLRAQMLLKQNPMIIEAINNNNSLQQQQRHI